MRRAFLNCRMFDRDDEAFIIEDGRFTKFGANAGILADVAPNEETIDLAGMYVVPGFVDSHMHLLETGYYLRNVQLIGCTSRAQVAKKLQAACFDSRKWVIGRGYDDSLYTDGRIDRSFLDEISSEKPIVLRRVCGHESVLNSKALDMMAIDEETVCEGGTIDLEYGIVREKAVDLVQSKMPQPDVEEIKDMILEAERYCASFGITSVGTDDFLSVTDEYRPVLTAYEQLAYQERLHLHIIEQCEFKDAKEFAVFLDEGYSQGVTHGHFTIGPLKLIADGSLGAHTAALSKPYIGTETTGDLLYKEEDMRLLVQMANRFNMGVIIHCIGDAALDQVLAVFGNEMYEGNPLGDGIVHCQIMRHDQVTKIKKLGLGCYFQSLFIGDDAALVKEVVPEVLQKSAYPHKTLLEACSCGNGSDSPVCVPNVLRGISFAVTRADQSGNTITPEEAMTVDEAVLSYTEKAASLLGMEETGKLCEGYHADFVVLEKDLHEIAPTDLEKCRVMMTVSEGETVFER